MALTMLGHRQGAVHHTHDVGEKHFVAERFFVKHFPAEAERLFIQRHGAFPRRKRSGTDDRFTPYIVNIFLRLRRRILPVCDPFRLFMQSLNLGRIFRTVGIGFGR